jgi:hypothetical protein
MTVFGCKLKGATWGKGFKRPKLLVYSGKEEPKGEDGDVRQARARERTPRKR